MHDAARQRGEDVQVPIREGRDIGVVLERELEEARELAQRDPALLIGQGRSAPRIPFRARLGRRKALARSERFLRLVESILLQV